MKNYKTFQVIIAGIPDAGYVGDQECVFEQQFTDETVYQFSFIPMAPIYKSGKRKIDEKFETTFVTNEPLKLAS